MQHPNKKQRKHQAKVLADLPEEQREEHAQLFRFINAAYIYHTQAKAFNPTKEDFEEWLTGLPKNIRNHMEIIGFALCKDVVSFQRYVLEKNDIGMDKWMKNNLSENDYNDYWKLIETRANPE